MGDTNWYWCVFCFRTYHQEGSVECICSDCWYLNLVSVLCVVFLCFYPLCFMLYIRIVYNVCCLRGVINNNNKTEYEAFIGLSSSSSGASLTGHSRLHKLTPLGTFLRTLPRRVEAWKRYGRVMHVRITDDHEEHRIDLRDLASAVSNNTHSLHSRISHSTTIQLLLKFPAERHKQTDRQTESETDW